LYYEETLTPQSPPISNPSISSTCYFLFSFLPKTLPSPLNSQTKTVFVWEFRGALGFVWEFRGEWRALEKIKNEGASG